MPQPSSRTSKQQEKPSALKREHPAQNMKFLHFFLFVRVIFVLLDPDPAGKTNGDP